MCFLLLTHGIFLFELHAGDLAHFFFPLSLSILNYVIRAKAHTYREVQRTDVPVI